MSNTAIEIGQAIGGYSALIAAIIAGVAAWIAYRLRPLKMRSIELHSEGLKKTILQWLSDMKVPDSPGQSTSIPGTHGYVEQIPEPTPYALQLEKDILFRDIFNHLPSSVWEKWASIKKSVDDYLRAKRDLTERVLLFATAETGLRVYDSSGKLPTGQNVLTHDVPHVLFEDLNRICNGQQPRWFNVGSAYSPEVVFKNEVLRKMAYNLVCSNSEQESRETYDKLSRALKESRDLPGLLLKFKEHHSQFDDLCSLEKSLREELQEWLKVPILPKECNLLKKGAR